MNTTDVKIYHWLYLWSISNFIRNMWKVLTTIITFGKYDSNMYNILFSFLTYWHKINFSSTQAYIHTHIFVVKQSLLLRTMYIRYITWFHRYTIIVQLSGFDYNLWSVMLISYPFRHGITWLQFPLSHTHIHACMHA